METYIKTVLEQVRCRKAHAVIRRELEDHLEEQTQAYQEMGMNEEEATARAVQEMGDPVETGISLDRIHRPQKAFGMLIFMGILTIGMSVLHVTGQDTGFAIYAAAGYFLMCVIYFLDYSWLGQHARVVACVLQGIYLLFILCGDSMGVHSGILHVFGTTPSVFTLLMLYPPVFGAVLTGYYGTTEKGLAQAMLWMVLPIGVSLYLRQFVCAFLLLFSASVMLTMTIGKGWFSLKHSKRVASALPCSIAAASVMAFIFYARIGNDNHYPAEWLQDYLHGFQGLFRGQPEVLSGSFLEYDKSLFFAYIMGRYGLAIGILVTVLLIVLVTIMFRTALRQSNPLGQMIGTGCALVIAVNAALNLLINLGVLPGMPSFLPFVTEGGSYLLVSYLLMGLVLSIFRFKTIYSHPLHRRARFFSA